MVRRSVAWTRAQVSAALKEAQAIGAPYSNVAGLACARGMLRALERGTSLEFEWTVIGFAERALRDMRSYKSQEPPTHGVSHCSSPQGARTYHEESSGFDQLPGLRSSARTSGGKSSF